jgi:hypothetical protein
MGAFNNYMNKKSGVGDKFKVHRQRVDNMAIRVVEFLNGGYKIRKVFA